MKLLPLASSTWSQEEKDSIRQVLDSGKLSMGPKVEEFESEFSRYLGSKFSVMFNSGSSANLAMLAALRYTKALEIPAKGEILVPSVSWSTTYYPVHQLGYTLKFVDVDPGTLNLDPTLVEAAISERTIAILAVNLLGNPADLLSLRHIATKNNIVLLEDNCESLGAELGSSKAGTYGLMSSHSFYFSHHICTMEGGMVSTDSTEIRDVLLSLRSHGWLRDLGPDNSIHPLSDDSWEDLFKFVLPGYNLRPLEMSGAVGLVQLAKFAEFLNNRRSNAAKLQKLVDSSSNFSFQVENGRSSWFGFSILLKNELRGRRREILDLLRQAGVETRPVVAGNFARNPVVELLRHAPVGPLPVADIIHSDGFFIGNHHYDISLALERVVEQIQSFRP